MKQPALFLTVVLVFFCTASPATAQTESSDSESPANSVIQSAIGQATHTTSKTVPIDDPVQTAPKSVPDPSLLLREQIKSSIRSGRFFDAHVLSLVGQATFPTKIDDQFILLDAYSLWKLGDTDAAVALLVAAQADAPDSNVNLGAMKSFVLMKQGDTEAFMHWATRQEEALKHKAYFYVSVVEPDVLRKFETEKERQKRESTFTVDPQLGAFADQYANVDSISPWTTGILSAILPGAGHAALGLWEDAAMTFVLNALTIGTSVDMFIDRNYFAGAAAVSVASFFYIGGILSSVKIANRRRADKEAESLGRMEMHLFPDFVLTF